MATAIVMAGAGARGAYEAGILSVVIPKLLEENPKEEIVLVGTSAGAINAAIIAGTAHAPRTTPAALHDAWCLLDKGNVFRVQLAPLLPYVLEVVTAGLTKWRTYGILDTSPLLATIDGSPHVDFEQLARNVGPTTWVKSAGVVATDIVRGTSVVFAAGMQKSLPANERNIEYRQAKLTGAHVRASAAIPLVFPNVEIPNFGWFSDGGVRLNTPISPGLELLRQLGSETKRIVIVGTHPDPSTTSIPKVDVKARRPDIIAEGASILHSLLVDRVAEDVARLRLVNAALSGAGRGRARHPNEKRDLELIDHVYFGPRQAGEIAARANTVFKKNYRSWGLNAFSLVSRGLGSRGRSRSEILSFLFFDHRFLKSIFELGRDEARIACDGGIPWATTPTPVARGSFVTGATGTATATASTGVPRARPRK